MKIDKKKTITIIFDQANELEKAIEQDIEEIKKSGKASKKDGKTIYFDTPGGFAKFYTLHKQKLLSALFNKKFSSIYELANHLGRDFSSVFKDCSILEELGFINLVEGEGSSKRKTKAPELSFSYNCIHIPQEELAIPVNLFDKAEAA